MRKELIITKENGYKIAAEAFIPEGGGKYPTVIFSHGIGANYRQILHHGEYLMNEGIACVLFDFCGGGLETKSDGIMEEMTILTEVEDLSTVVEAVKGYDFADPGKLYLAGESMGGFVASYVAAEIPEDIKAIILWYPAFVIPEDSRARINVGMSSFDGMTLAPDFNKVAMSIDIYKKIAAYKRPVKIIHGDMDHLAPLSYSQKAVKVYENASLLVIEGAGHGFDGEDREKAISETAKFVKRVEANT